MGIAALAVGSFVTFVTALSLLRAKSRWIRIWDFPRLQLAVLGLAALAAGGYRLPFTGGLRGVFLTLLALATAYQIARVWRYSPLAPKEVQQSRTGDAGNRLGIAIANVLQTNRDAQPLIEALRDVDPDVVLCVETDEWWRERLDVLETTHPHTVKCPQSNTYGMLLYSRLPLHDVAVDHLVRAEVPSMQAKVALRNGQRVWLNCLHPRPPAPGQSDDSRERDAELILVGKRVCDAPLPVVVCGDLNDVAWSHTTRLFQKTSRLIDPRKGRGLFSTFHARVPGLRAPLDHIFHSDDFRLVKMQRLAYVGSDHFPVYALLSLEPDAERQQEAPQPDREDAREARETVARA